MRNFGNTIDEVSQKNVRDWLAARRTSKVARRLAVLGFGPSKTFSGELLRQKLRSPRFFSKTQVAEVRLVDTRRQDVQRVDGSSFGDRLSIGKYLYLWKGG